MRYFFDTEFIERGSTDPIVFLSIGIVSEDDREFYFEAPNAREIVSMDFARHGDRWLIEHVRPHLANYPSPFYGRDAREEIMAFCGDAPEFWAYYADYDWVVLCQMFGRMVDLPKGWPMYCRDLKQLMDDRGVKRDALPQNDSHYALTDARWVRAAFEQIKDLEANR